MIMKCLQGYEWGFLEEVLVEACGLIRVKGWSKSDVPPVILKCGKKEIPAVSKYRTYRPDIPQALSQNLFPGFMVEFLCFKPCQLLIEDHIVCAIDLQAIHAHYEGLFLTSDILHREDIYGSGPPNTEVYGIPNDVLQLTSILNGSVLDFGCGSGILVQLLRRRGINAYGIELSSEIIKSSINPDVNPFITLYDGKFPTPYPNKSFDNIICSEVLEHIQDYSGAVQEFVRIAKDKVVITVPDISAIPLLHQHGVVPWHLLEATHINFFTQKSLYVLLSQYFEDVKISKICSITINKTTVYRSLAAICTISQEK